ncbi:Carbon monoxide dehydrogenase subunit G [Geodermatophilus obscurus]|uniref:Carbon monoxide dehydrogenase subunit G n=1 Tax=Geodermatophilus obscurus TaxID=1861 RepID=A0A1M7UW31_9ACTN|nr:SRPBCC family protein [Geodermatophilus obscurus]SHN87179.1 Carbon monoxide dehydrogenase subunit G [Geodermatophilus obscurus]
MQLENSFTVPVPIDEAWRVLLDIERIAPCMPGAALDSVTGDDFTGRVKVKLGPINLTYQGKASFIEKDADAHKAVIDGRGKDQRGNGTAAALITAQLKAEGDTTRVDVLTDLNITGRPAQFGRGVMTDVGNKLLGQFADKLAVQLGAGDAGATAVAAPAPAEKATPAKQAAATAAGAAEEIAASVEQVPADNAVAERTRRTAAAAKKTAAAATDGVSGGDTAPAAADAAPAAGDTAPAAVIPPPPTRTAAPAAPAARTSGPEQAEPEPIDLLEVAGGAALTRYAAPLAGAAALLLIVTLVVRRRRR